MILDEIVLHDFGVYGGRQTIELTPPSAQKPVILFGGLNGGGKTTLLDAIQLCLFGSLAQCSNRASLAYHDYLRRCIHSHASTEEAAIELTFRQRRDGVEHHYHLHRSWRVTGKGCREHFQVVLNGEPDPAIAENWLHHVQEFLPANIAHLFLFDGEKIEAYASDEHSAQLIGSAIENLLGLDIVDQLQKDLETLDRRKRTEQKTQRVRDDVESTESEIRLLRSRVDELRQERASVLTHKFDQAKKALKSTESQYRKLGGELFDAREAIETRKSDAKVAEESGKAALRDLASGELPISLISDLLEDAVDRDGVEQDGRLARAMLETLEGRDAAFLAELQMWTKSSSLLKKAKDLHRNDRKQREAMANTPLQLNLSVEGRSRLNLLSSELLDRAATDAKGLLAKQVSLAQRLSYVQTEFDSIPAPDTLATVLKKRDAAKATIVKAQSELDALDTSLERLHRDIDRKQHALARTLETGARSAIENTDRDRIIAHATKVSNTIGQFRQAVIDRHVKRIEALVFDSYQQLLRKTSLVSRMTIDPLTFEITLFGKQGRKLEPARLSAGERQLLGVALLWGLAKASGRPLPTAIDTPLGRLDTTHRAHLIERYFPFASHQVLLLSTDEEITGDYLKKLSPRIGRRYRLEFDDATGSTRVLPGYFEDSKERHVH